MHLNIDINLGVDIEEVYVPFAYKLCYYCPFRLFFNHTKDFPTCNLMKVKMIILLKSPLA